MDIDTDSDSHSAECCRTAAYDAQRVRQVFEAYVNKIFSTAGFVKHMNQRCTRNDITGYILLCEAIKRNDNKSAMLLLNNHCKSNMGKLDPNKDIPLLLATLAGNTEIVEKLLYKGARVKISFQDGRQPLHLICDRESTSIPDESSRIAIAKLLIKYGASVNAAEYTSRDTPLILAVRSHFWELTKFLLNAGSDRHSLNKNNETAFHIAFSSNAGIDMIELLYDEKFDLYQIDNNDCTLFYSAVRNLMNPEFTLDLLNYKPHTIDALLQPIQFLLEHGISVNSPLDKWDNKILHMICLNSAANAMEIFLQYGAEVNARNVDGKTPLHFCAANQSVDLVELLLSYEADVTGMTNNGQSVLHFAAANKDHHVLQLLLKHGLDVNAKDKDSFTPLFNAVWSNRCTNVKLLLKSQANVNERIINNQIALHVAVDQKHISIVHNLLEHGADINVLDDYGNTPLTISLNQIVESPNSDWSYDDADDIPPAEIVQRLLIKHTAKLHSMGLHVSDQSLRIMRDSHFVDYFEGCCSELNRMKETMIIPKVSFFNALTYNTNKLLTNVRNDNFMDALNSNNYKDKFLIYSDNVEHSIDLALIRLKLVKISTNNLIRIVQNVHKSWADVHLPILIIEHILSYLSINDLENFSFVYEQFSVDP